MLLKYPCLPIDYLFFHSATPIFLGDTPNLKNRCGAKKNRCGARKFFARSARGATRIQNPVHASGWWFAFGAKFLLIASTLWCKKSVSSIWIHLALKAHHKLLTVHTPGKQGAKLYTFDILKDKLLTFKANSLRVVIRQSALIRWVCLLPYFN